MDLTTARKWADSAGKPNPYALRTAGYVGIFLYGGNPGEKKNCTPEYYQSCRAAGLNTAWWFEISQTDYLGGEGIGETHALRLLADMVVCHAGLHEPCGATVDTHLTAANIPLAVAYQRGFWKTMHLHPVIAYGFAEFIAAVITAGVADIYVQAGAAHQVLNDIHFWQDNTQQPVISGVTIDIDWQLLPIPEPPMTDPLDEPIARQGTHYDGTPETGTTDLRAEAAWWDHAEELLQGLIKDTHAAVTALQADVDNRLTQLGGQLAALDSQVTDLLSFTQGLKGSGNLSGVWSFIPSVPPTKP